MTKAMTTARQVEGRVRSLVHSALPILRILGVRTGGAEGVKYVASMVWVAVFMSGSFGCADELAGVVVGLVLGQVEIRLFERRSQWGQLDEGDVVRTGGRADGAGVHSGHDHGAVGSTLDQCASSG